MSSPALAIQWAESGAAPDAAIRFGIRRLIKERLAEIGADDCERAASLESRFVAMMKSSPVALVPQRANEQHYELPAALFRYALGSHLKYSSGYWPAGVDTLDAAERAALEQVCERAGLADGMRMLELGCGWGSLTLHIAQRYPRSSIVGVSNSRAQREHVIAEAARRGLTNVRVVTADMNEFSAEGLFDRIVSIEMFEHMRNYPELFRRLRGWLEPNGRFFMHIFSHRSVPYEFVDHGPTDWMTRYFFAGGIMPSHDLPLHFQADLRLVERWRLSGDHYRKTADAWLENFDREHDALTPVLNEAYGGAVEQWRQRWRIFFMACSELFGYARGQEWGVSHYLFERADAP